MTKHTPAPWKVEEEVDATWISGVNPKDNVICDIVGRDYDLESGVSTITDEDICNAHLIAAAPELLDALNELLEQFISSTEMTDTYCDVCETHAHKYVDSRNNWTGQVDPIKHKPDCAIGKAENAIAKAKNETSKAYLGL